MCSITYNCGRGDNELVARVSESAGRKEEGADVAKSGNVDFYLILL